MLCMIFLGEGGGGHQIFFTDPAYTSSILVCSESLASFVFNKLWFKNCFLNQTHDLDSKKHLLFFVVFVLVLFFPVAPLTRLVIFRLKLSSSVDNVSTRIVTMFSREDEHSCMAAITIHVHKIAPEDWLCRDSTRLTIQRI